MTCALRKEREIGDAEIQKSPREEASQRREETGGVELPRDPTGGRPHQKPGERHGPLLPQRLQKGDFPGGPVAKTPRSQCRGPGFDPWSGN